MLAIHQSAADLLVELGPSEVARALGVSRQAVHKWRLHGVPPDRAEALRQAFPRVGVKKLRAATGRGRSGR